jgi:uncharacterized protein YjbI with pentapeptide repeats
MKWQRKWAPVHVIGILLLVASLVITILGYLNQHYSYPMPKPLEYFITDFYANLSTEFISIAITVLIINQLYERSKLQKTKDQLIRQMGFAGNELARLAVDELRAHGWLEDGSLCRETFRYAKLSMASLISANLARTNFTNAEFQNADIKWANLHGATLNNAHFENSLLIGTDLSNSHLKHASLKGAYLIETKLQYAELMDADFTGSILWGVNLSNAEITDIQLKKALMLSGAVLPDGSIYDGRFNLKGDIRLASSTIPVDDTFIHNDKLIGIDPENKTHARQYLRWKWASENLEN